MAAGAAPLSTVSGALSGPLPTALTARTSMSYSVADAGSTMFLDGLTIDYSDDLIQAGFRFNNPNASNSCGCGSSFGA